MPDHLPDTGYLADLFRAGGQQPVDVAKGVRYNLCRLLAHIADVQAEEQPPERAVLTGFDRVKHIVGAFVLNAFQ